MTAMRMFAAVQPPPEVEAAVDATVRRLRARADAASLRWTEPARWHLTVAFYGRTDPAVVSELRARLARAARRTAPFTVRLAGGGQFDGGSDRTLWAAVTEGRPELTRLAARAVAAGHRAGAGPPAPRGSGRRYHPHVTLARTRRGEPSLDGYVAALDAELRTPDWSVDRMLLIHSVLPSGGTPGEQPRYETVADLPLGR